MTTIRYFIPEDGDEEVYPNVFLAAKSRHQGVPPSLGQIRDAFPLPGRYHFRFKSPLVPGGDRDKDGMAVWMDCVQDNQPVPTWRNGIVAKVTRVGVEDDEDDDDDDFVNHHSGGAAAAAAAQPPIPHSHSAPLRSTPSAPAPPQQPAQRTTPVHTNHGPALDIFDGPSPSTSTPTPIAATSLPTSAPPRTGNLLDGHHHAPAPASGGLLDMDSIYGNHGTSNNNNNAHSDFLGMTAPTMTTAQHHQAPLSGGFNINAASAYGQQQQYPQQQQQQQQQQQRQNPQNAFSSFTDQQGPFGGLGTPWK